MAEPSETTRVLAATTAVLTFAAMTALYPAAIAPTLGRALGLPAAAIGVQISLVYAGAMATSLMGGALTHRTGACRASQLALLLLAVGIALAAVPWSATFMLASLLIGLGYGMTNPAASHLLSRFTPARRRGLVFGVKQTGVPLGGMLAGLVAPSLAINHGWRWALLALLLPAVVGIALLQPQRRIWDDDRVPDAAWLRSPFADLALIWKHRSLRFISLAGTCFAATQLSLSVFTVSLLYVDLEVPLVQAGLVMSAVQITGTVGRICWGWLADRLGNGLVTLMMAASITVSGAIIISLMSPSWPLAMAVTVLCVLSFSALGWNGVYLAEVARLAPPGEIARASGGSLFFTFTGVLIGPPAFSLLRWVLDSYTLGFLALAGVAASGLALLLAARRAERGELRTQGCPVTKS